MDAQISPKLPSRLFFRKSDTGWKRQRASPKAPKFAPRQATSARVSNPGMGLQIRRCGLQPFGFG